MATEEVIQKKSYSFQIILPCLLLILFTVAIKCIKRITQKNGLTIITCEFSKEVKARLEESYAEILFYTDNAIVAILSEVYITSNFETIPLSNLNNILDGLFFEFQEDNDTELSKLYRECDIETYVKEANTYLNIVMEILRPMKFTENGILMSRVCFYTSFYFEDFPRIEIDTLPYKALRRLKISKKENIKEIYQKRVNKIYDEVSLIDSYTQTN